MNRHFRNLTPTQLSENTSVRILFSTWTDALFLLSSVYINMADDRALGFLEEIRYLRGILKDQTCSVPLESPVHWDKVMSEQDRVLNTLQNDLAIQLVDLEQRMRKNRIRFFGLPEIPNEHTKFLVMQIVRQTLHFTIVYEDLDACYRCGIASSSRPRSIVAEFINDHMRTRILKSKTVLMRNGIFVEEELCKELLRVKKQAIRKFGVTHVKVQDSCIEVTAADGVTRKIYTMLMLQEFVDEFMFRENNYLLLHPHRLHFDSD